jgi:hypothetical protein
MVGADDGNNGAANADAAGVNSDARANARAQSRNQSMIIPPMMADVAF